MIDDRLYQYILSTAIIDESFKTRCLLNSVSVTDLVKSLTAPARLLLRNSQHLPYEAEYTPDAGTEHLGEEECDADNDRSWSWYPPASIKYEVVDEEAYGLTRLNPLTQTLQVLRLPPFSRSLWGEMFPALLKSCPRLRSLGRASGSMLGLELAIQYSREQEAVFLETGLEEVFMHLDMLNESDQLESPNISQLDDGGVICQNSPNLRFMIQNFGSSVFQPVSDDDSEEVFLNKEFGLDIWDYANTLAPSNNVEKRIRHYLDLVTNSCPKLRSLNIFCLSYAENVDLTNNTQLWRPLMNLKQFEELTLQIDHLIQFVGLILCVGRSLKKISVTEMIGNRHQAHFSSEYDGLDLDEQGALFICEQCPNVQELDLACINFMRKFFFGRQMIISDGHFEKLTKFCAGKIDWNSFFQLWKLFVNVKEIELAVIVPMFTLNQQLFEDAKVLTIFEVQDLFRANKRIKATLQLLQINSFRFATFEAAMYFLQEFRNLQRVGTIDMENLNQDDRAKMKSLVNQLKRERDVKLHLSDIFDGFY